MNSAIMTKTIKHMIKKYGVVCHWNRYATYNNGYGVEIVDTDSAVPVCAKVLLISQSDNPKHDAVVSTGLSANFAKYVFMLPDIDMRKDDMIIDNFGFKWTVGTFDYIAIGTKKVAKYAPLDRADGEEVI
jgi:hypothetical protein